MTPVTLFFCQRLSWYQHHTMTSKLQPRSGSERTLWRKSHSLQSHINHQHHSTRVCQKEPPPKSHKVSQHEVLVEEGPIQPEKIGTTGAQVKEIAEITKQSTSAKPIIVTNAQPYLHQAKYWMRCAQCKENCLTGFGPVQGCARYWHICGTNLN